MCVGVYQRVCACMFVCALASTEQHVFVCGIQASKKKRERKERKRQKKQFLRRPIESSY